MMNPVAGISLQPETSRRGEGTAEKRLFQEAAKMVRRSELFALSLQRSSETIIFRQQKKGALLEATPLILFCYCKWHKSHDTSTFDRYS